MLSPSRSIRHMPSCCSMHANTISHKSITSCGRHVGNGIGVEPAPEALM